MFMFRTGTVVVLLAFASTSLAEEPNFPFPFSPDQIAEAVRAAGAEVVDVAPRDDLPGNLIRNGSFELRDGGSLPANIDTLQPGRNEMVGWQVVLRPIDWIGPERWQASHGSYSLDMDGGVQQTVATTSGMKYELLFDLAGNVELPPAQKTLDVSISDSQLLEDTEPYRFRFDATGRSAAAMGWETRRIEFTAVGASTILTFLNAEPNEQSSGVALDNVRLRPLSEVTVDEPHEVYLVRQIRGLLEEARGLRAAGRIEEAEQHVEKARYRRGQLEEWLERQFAE